MAPLFKNQPYMRRPLFSLEIKESLRREGWHLLFILAWAALFSFLLFIIQPKEILLWITGEKIDWSRISNAVVAGLIFGSMVGSYRRFAQAKFEREKKSACRDVMHEFCRRVTEPAMIHDSGLVYEVNGRWQKLFGFENRTEALDWAANSVLPDVCDYGQEPVASEKMLTKKNGIQFVAEVHSWLIHGQSVWMSIVRDQTERHRLEREVTEISDTERQRIAHDLHDSLGQLLTGVAFKAKYIQNKMLGGSTACPEEIGELVNLLNKAIFQTRDLAKGLSPVNLKDGGFDQALRVLASQVEEYGRLPCGCEIGDGTDIMDAVVCRELYRIAQEALCNAMKYALANKVEIKLSAMPSGGVCLTVADDGVGCSPGGSCDGMGLHIMRYRARSIGAQFDIFPNSPSGTVVRCQWEPQSTG